MLVTVIKQWGRTLYKLNRDITANDIEIVEEWRNQWSENFKNNSVSFSITLKGFDEVLLQASSSIHKLSNRSIFNHWNGETWIIDGITINIKYNGCRTDKQQRAKFNAAVSELTDMVEARRESLIDLGFAKLNARIRDTFDYVNKSELSYIEQLVTNPNSFNFSDDDDPEDLKALESIEKKIKEIEAEKEQVQERIRLNRVKAVLEYTEAIEHVDEMVLATVRSALEQPTALKIRCRPF